MNARVPRNVEEYPRVPMHAKVPKEQKSMRVPEVLWNAKECLRVPRVPRSAKEYLGVPKSIPKNPRVPRSAKECLRVPE